MGRIALKHEDLYIRVTAEYKGPEDTFTAKDVYNDILDMGSKRLGPTYKEVCRGLGKAPWLDKVDQVGRLSVYALSPEFKKELADGPRPTR